MSLSTTRWRAANKCQQVARASGRRPFSPLKLLSCGVGMEWKLVPSSNQCEAGCLHKAKPRVSPAGLTPVGMIFPSAARLLLYVNW